MQLFGNIIYLCNKQSIMKQIFTLILSIGFCTAVMAQAHTETVKYQKIDRQAVVNDIPFSEKTIREAIENKMGQLGYKGKESKGFVVYQGVKMAELGKEAYDLYFMADKKSRRDKDNSTLTLMISKGFDAFVADSSDVALISNAKEYLNNIKAMVGAYDLEQQIIAQEDAIKKADKKYNNTVEDGISLEKKRKNIEKDIEDNKKDQASQQAEIEKQRQILQTLRGKRKQ
jgi:hypothetical protein